MLVCYLNDSLKQRYANSYCFVAGAQSRRTPIGLAMELFEQHQGTHILQVRSDYIQVYAAKKFYDNFDIKAIRLFVYFHNLFNKKCSKKHTQSLSILELDFVLCNRWPTSRFFTACSYNSMRTIDRPQHTPK